MGIKTIGEDLWQELLRLRRCEKHAALAMVAVLDLIRNSHGVAGLHLNGEVAPWDELRTGGQFEKWLKDFDKAIGVMEGDE